MSVRVLTETGDNYYLLRLMAKWSEIAYLQLGISGLQVEIEFPSDWHEERKGWVRFGLGLFKLAFSFPWKWVVPDEYQCSGPTYGFGFHGDALHLHWGKCKGTRNDPIKVIDMPWSWGICKWHKILTAPETHDYTYYLKSGEVQNRKATIQKEQRCWTRFWLPWKRIDTAIDVTFDDEVGERSGSWKGGTIGCSYSMKDGETPLDTLRRMEKERKF